MSDGERERLRGVQDRFLALPRVKRIIADGNGDLSVSECGRGPTYLRVRDQLHPAWERWFIEVIDNQGG